jgi:DAPG hydrolase PhiG domain
MSAAELRSYLERPLSPPSPDALEQIARGPLDRAEALPLGDLDRLLDPRPIAAETGWCWLADGVGYVAARTEMPAVTGEMVDWWFDWHPHDPVRYRIWHPTAHTANTAERPARRGAKAHWGTVHHAVEDVGVGTVRARIEFCAPTEMGMSTDALEHPDVATIVCGFAGDDDRHMRHTPMVHVWLRDGDGVVLRSRFWLGAALRPYGPLGFVGERALNHRAVRRRVLPRNLPRALATHCAEEYANLGALLPWLYARFGP